MSCAFFATEKRISDLFISSLHRLIIIFMASNVYLKITVDSRKFEVLRTICFISNNQLFELSVVRIMGR